MVQKIERIFSVNSGKKAIGIEPGKQLLKNKRERDKPLWNMSRPTAWRTVKRVMTRAGIEGPQATTKGFRHELGIALAQAKTPATAIRDIGVWFPYWTFLAISAIRRCEDIT